MTGENGSLLSYFGAWLSSHLSQQSFHPWSGRTFLVDKPSLFNFPMCQLSWKKNFLGVWILVQKSHLSFNDKTNNNPCFIILKDTPFQSENLSIYDCHNLLMWKLSINLAHGEAFASLGLYYNSNPNKLECFAAKTILFEAIKHSSLFGLWS